MATDVQLLVLSEGKSNLLPADSVVPFQPSSAGPSEIEEAAMQTWRWYLGTLRSLSHSISPGMQKVSIVDVGRLDASVFKYIIWSLTTSSLEIKELKKAEN